MLYTIVFIIIICTFKIFWSIVFVFSLEEVLLHWCTPVCTFESSNYEKSIWGKSKISFHYLSIHIQKILNGFLESMKTTWEFCTSFLMFVWIWEVWKWFDNFDSTIRKYLCQLFNFYGNGLLSTFFQCFEWYIQIDNSMWRNIKENNTMFLK